MNNLDKDYGKIPSIDLKIETKTVKSENRKLSSKYTIIKTPYMLFSEYGKDKVTKIWTSNKKKIILYYLYRLTKINWFIKKYNEQPRQRLLSPLPRHS